LRRNGARTIAAARLAINGAGPKRHLPLTAAWSELD
jgi:hypothetical protein